MSRRPAGLLLGVAAAWLAAAPCDARVFLRWRGAADSRHALRDAGGRLAYESAVTVNGRAGTLAVFAYDRPIGEVVSALSRALGAPFAFQGGTLALCETARAERRLRLLAAEFSRRGRTVVFAIEMPEGSAGPADAAAEALPGVGAYPGTTATFTAADPRGAFRLHTGQAPADPSAALAHFDAALMTAGWQAAGPAPRGAPSSLRIYAKGADLCLVSAQAAEGGSRITVLHKRNTGDTNASIR